uniref:hypothetical protein n=1 Tax=Xanthomonas oryzae TaxID=347 RepID=UPI003DA0433C
MTFGMGFSASGSYSSNKVNGDFASVKEQSGIQAGDGGFDIRVHGNTDLKGGDRQYPGGGGRWRQPPADRHADGERHHQYQQLQSHRHQPLGRLCRRRQ